MSTRAWPSRDTVDVVVVGAGPAGSAAATTAAAGGASVLLIDATPPDLPFRIGESLPPGGADLVRQVFGTGSFDEDAHLPSHGNRSLWGGDVPLGTDFMFNPLGVGWHLDRVAFDAALVAAAERSGVEVWRQATVIDVTATTDGRTPHGAGRAWALTVDTPLGEVEVRAGVVCDASGRRAAVARAHGARLTVADRLVAVAAVVAPVAPSTRAPTGQGRDTTTTVEAVESGWWYTAVIPDHRRIVAFLTDGDLLDPTRRTIDGFLDGLGQTQLVRATVESAMGPVVGWAMGSAGGTAPGPSPLAPTPVIVAAGTTALDRPVGPGWLAVGDAAAAFDPLSSQGIVTALLMGRAGGELLSGLVADPGTDLDPFEHRYATVLERFRTEHRATYGLERRWPHAPFWARRQADR